MASVAFKNRFALRHQAPASKRACSYKAAPGAVKSRAKLVVRAQNDDNEGNNVDWDAAWAQFQRQMKSQVSSQVQTKTTERPPVNPRLDAIRKQERLALDVWSSPWFPALGASLAVALLFVFVFGVGPPPADPRCTLPWC